MAHYVQECRGDLKDVMIGKNMQDQVNDARPRWEHGYRCHGYWLGEKRVGFVGIGPSGFWTEKDGYSWNFDLPEFDAKKGTAKSLREAKKAVEEAYKQYRGRS